MTYTFLLIGKKTGSWKDRMKEAVSTLGELQSVSETEAMGHVYMSKPDVIVIDESAVKRVTELIARFSSQLDPPHVIVAFASPPRWQEALRLFKAGATDCMSKNSEKDDLAIFFKDLLADTTKAWSKKAD